MDILGLEDNVIRWLDGSDALGANRFAVLGNPAMHSLSPTIQTRFAKSFGDTIDYRAVNVPESCFENVVKRFFDGGGTGLNITAPFKGRAHDIADLKAARADFAKAANVLWQDGFGNLVADNTDGHGLRADLELNLNWPIRDQKILIFGAGGAVQGILFSLLEQAPARIHIANRTSARALALANNWGTKVTGSGFDSLPDLPWDLVINSVSSSWTEEILVLPALKECAQTKGYDLLYGKASAAFFSWARTQRFGAVSDGLGMLVEQAAESYRLWRGSSPETRSIIEALRI